ncbi:MAG: protein-glutamate O-methyltransferase CheR [Sphingomonadales bacterium]|nr:protein-glutamate O-methyltransferase CheR [Sphingomonadales bacterium]
MNAIAPVSAAFGEGMPGVSPGVYDERDFHAVAAIVRDEAGIMLPPGKAMLVYSRLAPLVRNSGRGTFSSYLELVRADAEERRKAVCALTTNHTFFYREQHHFEHFAAEARPRILTALSARQPVRLWSAGCSSGEETWSLVMTLLGADKREGQGIARADLRVLASDIADHALAKAKAARYAARDLEAVPKPLTDAWTRRCGTEEAEIVEDARNLVQFRRLNLHGDWPIKRRFPVIFCRNVMIYFDQPAKERLIARFAQQLEPGGFLYIGHSERVSGPAEDLLQPVGPTIYRRSN